MEARYFIATVMTVAQFGVATVIATVTARAAAGSLARNQWTGIRTPSTMRSDHAWQAGHRAAHRLTPLYFVNAVAACAVLVVAVRRQWSVGAITGIGVAAFVTLIAIAVYATIRAGRAARSADD
jgi:uncharacterized membrane protein